MNSRVHDSCRKGQGGYVGFVYNICIIVGYLKEMKARFVYKCMNSGAFIVCMY